MLRRKARERSRSSWCFLASDWLTHSGFLAIPLVGGRTCLKIKATLAQKKSVCLSSDAAAALSGFCANPFSNFSSLFSFPVGFLSFFVPALRPSLLTYTQLLRFIKFRKPCFFIFKICSTAKNFSKPAEDKPGLLDPKPFYHLPFYHCHSTTVGCGLPRASMPKLP